MNKILPSVLLCCYCGNMFSQSHSDIWLIGRTLFPFEAIQFDFMSGLPTQSTVYTGIYMGSATNSSIGNENGELLMYT
ncbi:MAG: hypothetical protein EPO28_07465, partial [Saprospiraceae bacterium]